MPPEERPSTAVAPRMGRERPRRCAVHAAPEPTGEVAHAPCQCRICWGARVVRAGMLSENRTDENAKFSSGRNSQNCFASGPVPASVAPNFPGVIASWFAVAPVPDCPGALRRVKGPLRRCAPLTRPARSRCFAIAGATGTSRVRFLVGSQHAGAYLATTRLSRRLAGDQLKIPAVLLIVARC